MKTLWIRLTLALLALGGAATLPAQSSPPWKVVIEDSALVAFEQVTWHPKDFGWLLTFRLATPSQRMIRPITHVHFEGFDEQEEQVWSDSKVIRRKDMDSSLGGSDQQFVRALFKSVPDNVTVLKIRFDSGDSGGDS